MYAKPSVVPRIKHEDKAVLIPLESKPAPEKLNITDMAKPGKMVK